MGSTPSWRVAGKSGFSKIAKEREDCSADECLPKFNAGFLPEWRYTLKQLRATLRNIHEATLLYRLDARPSLRSHVSNALLRLLAQPRSAQVGSFCMVATPRYSPRATFRFSLWDFFCAGNGAPPRKRRYLRRNR